MEDDFLQSTNDDLRGIAGGVAFAAASVWVVFFTNALDTLVPGVNKDSLLYSLSKAIFVSILALIIFRIVDDESFNRQTTSESVSLGE